MKKIELSHRIEINRKVEDVFAYTSNLKKAKEWRIGLVKSKLLTDLPVREGSLIDETVIIIGMTMRSRTEITELIHNKKRKLRIKIGASGFLVKMEEKYKEKNGVTVLSISGTAKLKGFQQIMSKSIANQMQKQLEQEMDNIKMKLET